MAGFSTSCVVVGVLCLVGAVGPPCLLPGRIRVPVEIEGEPVEQVTVSS